MSLSGLGRPRAGPNDEKKLNGSSRARVGKLWPRGAGDHEGHGAGYSSRQHPYLKKEAVVRESPEVVNEPSARLKEAEF